MGNPDGSFGKLGGRLFGKVGKELPLGSSPKGKTRIDLPLAILIGEIDIGIIFGWRTPSNIFLFSLKLGIGPEFIFEIGLLGPDMIGPLS